MSTENYPQKVLSANLAELCRDKRQRQQVKVKNPSQFPWSWRDNYRTEENVKMQEAWWIGFLHNESVWEVLMEVFVGADELRSLERNENQKRNSNVNFDAIYILF